MIPYMVGKLAPNSSHLTRGLVKYVSGRVFFRAVFSQNGNKYVKSPPPFQSLNIYYYGDNPLLKPTGEIQMSTKSWPRLTTRIIHIINKKKDPKAPKPCEHPQQYFGETKNDFFYKNEARNLTLSSTSLANSARRRLERKALIRKIT